MSELDELDDMPELGIVIDESNHLTERDPESTKVFGEIEQFRGILDSVKIFDAEIANVFKDFLDDKYQELTAETSTPDKVHKSIILLINDGHHGLNKKLKEIWGEFETNMKNLLRVQNDTDAASNAEVKQFRARVLAFHKVAIKAKHSEGKCTVNEFVSLISDLHKVYLATTAIFEKFEKALLDKAKSADILEREDKVECPVCGAFVAPDAESCDICGTELTKLK